MSDTKQLYVYSINGSRYCDREEEKHATQRGWETREEALFAGREHASLVAGLKHEDPGPVWTGIKVGYQASAFFPDAQDIIGGMADRAHDETIHIDADDWPDCSDAAEEEIEKFVEETLGPFLTQWAEKHDLKPTFWSVTEVVKHADDDGAIEKTAPST